MTVTYVAGAYAEAPSAASLTMPIPAHNAGDFAVLLLGVNDTDSVPNTPTGWTKVAGDNIEGTIRIHAYYAALATTEASSTNITFTATGADYMLSRVEIHRSDQGGLEFDSYTFQDNTTASHWVFPAYTGVANVLVGMMIIYGTRTMSGAPALGSGTSNGTITQRYYGNVLGTTYRMVTASVLGQTSATAAIFYGNMSGSSTSNSLMFALTEIPSGGTDVSVAVPLGEIVVETFVPTTSINGSAEVDVPLGQIAVRTYASDNVTISIGADVPLGQITVQTYVPTVTASGDVAVAVPLAKISVVGYVPTVTAGGSVEADVPLGQVAIRTYVPTAVVMGSVTAEVPLAKISVIGYPPTVTAQASLRADISNKAQVVIRANVPTVSTGGSSPTTSIFIGDVNIADVYLGEIPIQAIYLGDTLIWSR